MLFFKKKEKDKETQEEVQQAPEVDQRQQELDAIREAHKDLPIPTILPMFLNKLNGDDAADLPEDTIAEDRKKELIELLYVPELGRDTVEQLSTQEVLFLMLAMELYNKASELKNFSQNHRVLYNEILSRVRDAEQIYMLFDRRTGYPFLYNGCVCIYLDKDYAIDAANRFRKIMRDLEVRMLPGEASENSDASAFAYLNFLGMNMCMLDNGKYRCRFRRQEIRVNVNFSASSEKQPQKPPMNPELSYALCDFLQEARWQVNYEKRDEVLKQKEARMLALLQRGIYLLPFQETEDGKRGVLIRKDKDGKQFLAIFTDEVELAKEQLPAGGGWKLRSITFPQLPLLMGNLAGAILNPNGHRIVIPAQQVAAALNAAKEAAAKKAAEQAEQAGAAQAPEAEADSKPEETEKKPAEAEEKPADTETEE